MRWRFDLKIISVSLIVLLAFFLIAIPVLRFKMPFSWDVWFHIRMGESFTHGFVWWDWGSFGPTGRPNLYPPAFHILLALISKIGGWSTQSIARYLPLLIYPATAFLVYYLSKTLFDNKTGALAALMYIFIPVAADRGVISSSQALATILLLASFIFYIKSLDDWRYSIASGVLGAGVVLSHGLTLIMLVVMVLTYTAAFYLTSDRGRGTRDQVIKSMLIFAALSALIPSYWLYYLFDHGVYSRIPESVALAIRDYPSSLGLLQLAISFVGAGFAFSRRGRSDIFIIAWAVATFVLSTSVFWVLPSRFIEFLALPVAILAAIGLREALTRNRNVALIGTIGLVLVTMTAPFNYLDSISPLVYENEEASFRWLGDETVINGQVMTGWFFAPVGAAISNKVPIKGSYYSGSFHYSERTNDTNDFYHGDMSILEKYVVKYVYVGRKEIYDYEEVSLMGGRDSLNKMFSCQDNSFYQLQHEEIR